MSDLLVKFSPEWWSAMTMPEPNTGCMFWLGWASEQGYGHVSVQRQGNRSTTAHRAAYESAYGPFDPSLKVCHRCDTPLCVNPEHLFLGTQKDNLHDMREKGRAREWGRGEPKATRILIAKEPMAVSVTLRRARTMSNEKTRKSVNVSDTIHLIGSRPVSASATVTYGADVPVWCRVTNVPPTRPTQAIVRWESAKSTPPELARNESAVATVADCCPGVRVALSGERRTR